MATQRLISQDGGLVYVEVELDALGSIVAYHYENKSGKPWRLEINATALSLNTKRDLGQTTKRETELGLSIAQDITRSFRLTLDRGQLGRL